MKTALSMTRKDGSKEFSLPAKAPHRERGASGHWDAYGYDVVVANVFTGRSEEILQLARKEESKKQNWQEPLTLNIA